MSGPSIALAALVNDEACLRANLLASPRVADGTLPFQAVRGARSAGEGLNRALDEAGTEVVVLAHQDIYLPGPWLAGLRAALARIEAEDTAWGVIGAFGLDLAGQPAGRAYDAGAGVTYDFTRPAPVRALILDEIVLAVRRGAGLRFDPALPGFHLYGTDLCLAAEAAGLSAWVWSGNLIHNTRLHTATPPGYLAGRRYLAAKWRARCPVPTLIMELSASPLPPLLYAGRMLRKRWAARGRAAGPPPDAPALARALGYEA